MNGTPREILEKSSRRVTLTAGLSQEEIARFQEQLPGVLPQEIRGLLAYSAGFEVVAKQLLESSRMGSTAKVVFTGCGDFGLEDVLPYSVALLGDGCGNFWVVDVNPGGEWGAVFFVCHDPPVIALQASDLGGFLDQVLNPRGSESKETLDYVRDAATTRIWRDDPWLMPVQEARAREDKVVSDFARHLPDNYSIADLRPREIGSGFSWGKAGPNAGTRRSGRELLFGVEQEAPSLLRRILGAK